MRLDGTNFDGGLPSELQEAPELQSDRVQDLLEWEIQLLPSEAGSIRVGRMNPDHDSPRPQELEESGKLLRFARMAAAGDMGAGQIGQEVPIGSAFAEVSTQVDRSGAHGW